MPRRPRRHAPDGFTLIELLIVILIIGVLVAVSAPSFLGQTEKAHDSAAKQYLTVAYREAAAASTDHDGDFTSSSFDASALASAIQAGEPELTVVSGSCPQDATTDQRHIVIDTAQTHGGDLVLCNDPTHTVWTLRVVDHQLQPFTATVVDGSGAPLVVAPASVTPPIVSGTPQVGQTLTTTPGTWSGSSAGYSYQWETSPTGSSWANAAGAGAQTASYTPDQSDLDHFLRVTVEATNTAGQASASSSMTSAVLPRQPANQTPPSFSGTVQEGRTLTADPGYWSDCQACAYSYTWRTSTDQLAWTNVGTDAATYVVQTGDIGKYVEVCVQASNSGGSAGACSTPSSQAATPAVPVNTAQPQITDADNALTHTQVGDHLSTTSGDWSNDPTGYSYTWQRAADASFTTGLTNVGSDSSTYVVQAADEGKYLRVSVQAQNAGGAGSALSGNQTAAVLPASPSNAGGADLPQVSGTTTTGQTLTATHGTWANAPTSYDYQWGRCDSGGANCVDVGADQTTYDLVSADAGHKMIVTVTAQNAGGSGTAASDPTATVVLDAVPANTVAPALTGTAAVGQTLQTDHGTWSGNVNGYAYQWQRCDSSGASCADIGGQTTTSYTLQAADEAHTVKAVVQASNTGGTAAAASAASAQVTVVQASCTGCTVSSAGGYVIYTFTASGSFTVSAGNGPVQALVVAGGGGGGSGYGSGGGGAGGVIQASSLAVSPQAYTVTVGAGGSAGASGGNSSFAGQTAVGGGNGSPGAGGAGGSGGGGGTPGGTPGGSATAGQGNAGGTAVPVAGAHYAGGGGGGAGGAGANATSNGGSGGNGGNGGAGITSSISGAALVYGAGGGGGSENYSGSPSTAGAGGSSCGGNGSNSGGTAGAGLANRGCGGGGGGGPAQGTGGSGGAGIVIIRYLAPAPATNTAAPAISGTAVQGQTLTGSQGTWTGSGLSYSYQWLRCNSGGTGCVNIASANASTYVVQSADVGGRLDLAVTATNNVGSTTAYSTVSGVVESVGANCTGCTATAAGGYRILTFTSSGTFTVSTPGAGQIDVLVVGGGGGGASTQVGGGGGGGGGAGGYLYQTGFAISAQAYTVTVGSGGSGGSGGASGGNGADSIFATLDAVGGGGGGSHNGGSGGGGTSNNAAPGGSGTAGQGHNGGAAVAGAVTHAGGGGGGSGTAGSQAPSAGVGGAGGAGTANAISGVSFTYAAGGGGGAESNSSGGGAAGASCAGPGGVNGSSNNGNANTGCGGGGGGRSGATGNGGAGGSGVVVIRFAGG